MESRDEWVAEIDSDVDLRVQADRDEMRRAVPLLFGIALGGVVGALGRFVISEAWVRPLEAFPWPMFTINVTGCFALGVLMTVLIRHPGTHPLARPTLGTGLLGGYTSFSSYAVDVHHLLRVHRPALGLLYLAASVIVGVAAVLAGRAVTTAAGTFAAAEGRGRA